MDRDSDCASRCWLLFAISGAGKLFVRAVHSLHMQAEAIDIRLPGLSTARLQDAALELHRSGVGYYPASDFVHVDVGRVRHW